MMLPLLAMATTISSLPLPLKSPAATLAPYFLPLPALPVLHSFKVSPCSRWAGSAFSEMVRVITALGLPGGTWQIVTFLSPLPLSVFLPPLSGFAGFLTLPLRVSVVVPKAVKVTSSIMTSLVFKEPMMISSTPSPSISPTAMLISFFLSNSLTVSSRVPSLA